MAHEIDSSRLRDMTCSDVLDQRLARRGWGAGKRLPHQAPTRSRSRSRKSPRLASDGTQGRLSVSTANRSRNGRNSADGSCRFPRLVEARAAAGLLQQADPVDLHAPVESLAHVVEGQGGNAGGGEGFHFDPGGSAQRAITLTESGWSALISTLTAVSNISWMRALRRGSARPVPKP